MVYIPFVAVVDLYNTIFSIQGDLWNNQRKAFHDEVISKQRGCSSIEGIG